MYKINGYRITKIRGELCLKKVREAVKQKSEEGGNVDDNESVDIETRLQRLEEAVNEIIDALNKR